jgi:hypothetical protein
MKTIKQDEVNPWTEAPSTGVRKETSLGLLDEILERHGVLVKPS